MKYLTILLMLLITGCGQMQNKRAGILVIDLSEAISNPEDEIKLSEIADSVSYIPLETTPRDFLGNAQFLSFQPEYIFYSNYCFSWEGKFLMRIGEKGRGNCEDPYANIAKVLYHKGYYYGHATKIIQYDMAGKCTGKEHQWYVPVEDPYTKFGNDLRNLLCVAPANENIFLYNFPDAVYFLDTNFRIVAKRPVMRWDNAVWAGMDFGVSTKYVSYYNDTVLFYNYFTDTVFNINSTSLSCRYVIKLGEKQKLPVEYLYRYSELLGDGFQLWKKGVNLDKSKMAKLVDHTFMVMGVYEANRYIFTVMREVIAFAKFRNIESLQLLGIYDKQTGKVRVVKKIIDDLGGMETFFPRWGACNKRLISTIWPYQIQDFINDRQEEGKTVNPKLLKLMKKIKPDDNPVMIFAYLKN